jgi:hypothetical protein
MKQKNTWVLLLVLTAVVVVLFLLVNLPEREESEKTAPPTVLAAIDQERISRVVVTTPRGTSTLRREGDSWLVEEFNDFPADLAALEEAITALRELELGDIVSDNREKQATFQVDQSGVEVQLYGDGGESDPAVHFFLGKPGQDYRSIYFRLADSDQVHLVDQQLRGRFDRGSRTWRNRRPFSFDLEEVSGLQLPAGESGEPLNLKIDDQGSWIVDGEKPVPADKAKVELVARSFAQLSADDFPEESDPDLSRYGLDEPLYTYSADLLDGSTRTLLVGSVTVDDNNYYVKREDSPIIYILGKFRIRNLSKTLDEIRLEPAAAPTGGEE